MFDDSKKMMASLALFRKLYKNEGMDVLVLLGEFIKLIIKKNSLYSFTASDIKTRLFAEYNFSIPEYVVETALKKFCNKENGVFSIKTAIILSYEDTNEIRRSNDNLVNKLIHYIEEKTHAELSASEREVLIQSLCEFIIEDTTQLKYADYISAFIIDYQTDSEIRKQLRRIKEGVILYTGIKFNDSIAELGSWKDDFTIYLEQEMLFHFIGYNGDLYKRLFDDFFELIKEINKKAKKELIKLRYFPEVESNINKFFAIAQRIADGKETLDPSNTAMGMIVNGCEDGADVITKKSMFYDFLKGKSILKSDDIYVSDKDNRPYNIYTSEKESELMKMINDYNSDIQQSLTFINYISICRKNKFTSLERSKCILLTGNNTTLKVDSSFKENGYVPYATTLDFMTNRIWRKLNKGFGDNNYPKSFDVVTKAQIVLSSHVADSVSKEFEDLKQKLSNGLITKEVAARTLIGLKMQALKPEEITTENINPVLLTISDIERAKRELDYQRSEFELTSQELKITKEEKRKTEQKKLEVEGRLRDKENELFQERNTRLKIEEAKKEKADKLVKKYDKLIRVCYYCIPLFFVVLIIFLIYHYTWDIMEQYTYLFSLFPYVLVTACNLIWGKSIKPRNILLNISQCIRRKFYKKFNVDESEIRRLKELTSKK